MLQPLPPIPPRPTPAPTCACISHPPTHQHPGHTSAPPTLPVAPSLLLRQLSSLSSLAAALAPLPCLTTLRLDMAHRLTSMQPLSCLTALADLDLPYRGPLGAASVSSLVHLTVQPQ